MRIVGEKYILIFKSKVVNFENPQTIDCQLIEKSNPSFVLFIKSILKMIRLLFIILFLPFLAVSQTDKEKATAEILALHHQQREFHFKKQTGEFAESLSDDVIMVNRGKVNMPGKDENIERWTNYFNAVEFVEWDDTAEPTIQFSKDGSMAYVVVQKKVVLNYVGETNDTIEETTLFAWVSIYEKVSGAWKITCNASTNRPSTYRLPNISKKLNEREFEVIQALEKFSMAYQDAEVGILSNMLTEQYVHSNSGGPIIRKKDWLNWVGSRKELIDSGELIYDEYMNENVTVEIYGDAAVVHGVNISSGTEKGNPFHKKIAFTHTWIKENEIWKRASFHDSRLP